MRLTTGNSLARPLSILRARALMPACAVALLVTSAPVSSAQQKTSVHAGASSDSTSWIVRRQPVEAAEAALETRNRDVAVLLGDTAIVVQITDSGLRSVHQNVADAPQSTGARILARMLGAGLEEMLDHGIAYRLSALRGARAEGSRLVLEDREGKQVFDKIEINGRDVMSDFFPARAERFAAAVNRAIRERR